MDLLALEDFNLVARHGGFGRAARASGRPKATLSRRVAELEEALGLRLFERGKRDSKLTEEGRTLHERTSAILGELDEIAAAVTSGKSRPKGVLRINAPVLFAQAVMGRLAARFCLQYPDVRLDVTAEDRAVDLVEEGYDLVIRVNPRPDEDLVGRRFLRDVQVVVSTPSFEKPEPGQPVRAILLKAFASDIPWRIRVDGGGIKSLVPNPVMTLSTFMMVRDAVRTGAGVAMLPLSLVDSDLRRGRLIEWGRDLRETELWALYTSRRLLNSRVTAFLEFLRKEFPTGMPHELARFMTDRSGRA